MGLNTPGVTGKTAGVVSRASRRSALLLKGSFGRCACGAGLANRASNPLYAIPAALYRWNEKGDQAEPLFARVVGPPCSSLSRVRLGRDKNSGRLECSNHRLVPSVPICPECV